MREHRGPRSTGPISWSFPFNICSRSILFVPIQSSLYLTTSTFGFGIRISFEFLGVCTADESDYDFIQRFKPVLTPFVFFWREEGGRGQRSSTRKHESNGKKARLLDRQRESDGAGCPPVQRPIEPQTTRWNKNDRLKERNGDQEKFPLTALKIPVKSMTICA